MIKEIIPTILVKTFDEVIEKIQRVENHVDWVQLDIMDGIFVNNKTWSTPADLKELEAKVKLEAHLMVKNPEDILDDWLEVVDRVIIHIESDCDIKKIIKIVHAQGKEIGLALNPETSVEVVKPFLNDLDSVLLMTVNPGWGGQKFEESVIPKIKLLREGWGNGKIEVDGGINSVTAKIVLTAGANILCVGSYLFKSENIKEAINSLL